ncbi:MAG: hypothetical protein M3O23_09645 [Actinomycetota bacterium]|nr:hypothetical protein [Actinomycetota bacterium]
MSVWDQWEEAIRCPDPDPLEVLRAAGMYQRYLFEIQDKAVKAARAQGHTWEEIARAVGTTRQAAWQRYGAVAPAPPSKHDLRTWLDDDRTVPHLVALYDLMARGHGPMTIEPKRDQGPPDVEQP